MENNLSKAIKLPVRYNYELSRIFDANDRKLVIVELRPNGHAFGHALAELINGLDGRGWISDEEIEREAREHFDLDRQLGFVVGAKYMRELLGGNSKPDRQVKSAEPKTAKEILIEHISDSVVFEYGGDITITRKLNANDIVKAMEIYAQQYK